MLKILLFLLTLIGSAFAQAYDFSGTVQINGCSGFFVRFEHSRETDQALVMTAGHCASLDRPLKNAEYADDMASELPVRFLKADGSLFDDTLPTDRLIYATVTGTDFALYSLPASYSTVMNIVHIAPLVLSVKRPNRGTSIQVLSGQLQTGYACSLEDFVYKLVESDYVWRDSLRYSRTGCKTVGGTSGSPVIDTVNGEVIGINNTGNLTGKRCSADNACEVSETGAVTFIRGASYGQQTYQIYTCLDKKRNFNLALPGCQLFGAAFSY